MNYITLICDIKSSRNIKEREKIQLLLISTLKKCNEKFKKYIVSDFIITLGDEWQGLLEENTPVNDIINFFHNELPQTLDFYVAIGIGEITIHDFELTVNQLDGPSFHLARKAMKYAKKNNCSVVLLIQ